MPDYAALKAEIALPAYAGKTDAEIATVLQTPITLAVDVSIGTVEAFLRTRLLLTAMQRFVDSPPNGASTQLVNGLAEFLGLILSPHVQTVAMTDPTVNTTVTAVINAAASAGLMTTQQAADLLALGKVQTTRAAQLGLADNHHLQQEITAARIWPGVSEA